MCVLKFEGVSKKYPYEKQFLLKSVSFEVHKGERVGIVAEKQCGKTSLVKMIAQLTQPTEGSIFYNGKPLLDTPFAERNIGIVFDDYALIKGRTVYKNVCYPLKVRKIKDFSAADDAIKRFDLGAVKDVKIKKLSCDDKLKTALARLSVRKTDLLVFDDVLRNIQDPATIKYTKKSADKDTAVLWLSSDVEDLFGCDRVYVIAEGQTAFCGSCAEAKKYIEQTKCFDKFGINDDIEKSLG